jgi:hypothetical protein
MARLERLELSASGSGDKRGADPDFQLTELVGDFPGGLNRKSVGIYEILLQVLM